MKKIYVKLLFAVFIFLVNTGIVHAEDAPILGENVVILPDTIELFLNAEATGFYGEGDIHVYGNSNRMDVMVTMDTEIEYQNIETPDIKVAAQVDFGIAGVEFFTNEEIASGSTKSFQIYTDSIPEYVGEYRGIINYTIALEDRFKWYFTYELDESTKTATITGLTEAGMIYVQETEVLEIPDSLIIDFNSYAVTAIGDNAFYQNNDLKNVVISDGISKLGYRAFAECENLRTVQLPDTITDMGDDIESSGEQFSKCISLTSINFPQGCTKVPRYFLYNTNVKEIIVPLGYTSIGEYAFASANVETLVLPDTVESTDDYICNFCRSLVNITVPIDLPFKENDFMYCNKDYRDVYVTYTAGRTGVGINYTSSTKEYTPMYTNGSGVALGARFNGNMYVIYSEGITSIGNRMWDRNSYGYNKLMEVYLPSTLVSIGNNNLNYKSTTNPNVHDIYYNGTEAEFNQKVSWGTNNNYISNTSFHFNE